MERISWRTITMLAAVLAGCSNDESPQTALPAESAPGPRPSVALRVVVVNEPELVEAIDRLQGEWADRTGGELRTSDKTWADLNKSPTVDADVLVFPSRYLGELCVREWLRPVRPNVLESKDFDLSDIFPVVRARLITWGGKTMALPLGVVLPEEVQIAAHPGMSLLDAAAPAAVSDDRIGVLFDPDTMRPRITETPFVEALTELSQRNSHDNNDALNASAQPRIPVLGFADRLVAVSNSSRNAASAFKLIEWLASAEISSQLSTSNESLIPVRRSLVSSSEWHGSVSTASNRDNLAAAVNDILSEQQALIIPRIPGIDDYLAALDQAVRAVTSGSSSPELALADAARKWEGITSARDRAAQRAAYIKHLGISDE